MTHIERTVDTLTGEVVEKPYDKKQLAELKVYADLAIAEQAEAEAMAQAKAALLERLGLTQEEFNILTAQS
jgi:hypothetical protein